MEKEDFPLLEDLPEELKDGVYCPNCFSGTPQKFINDYYEKESRAHDLPYFSIAQTKETRLISRSAPPIIITGCRDRREVILKLAYQTLELGFNGMIDLETSSEKRRNGGRQTSIWKGQAVPAHLDPQWLERKERQDR